MRVWAKGLLGLEAAVELLIGHGTWPARADFAEVALTSGHDGITGAEMASVDFEAALAARRAGGLPCSSGEEPGPGAGGEQRESSLVRRRAGLPMLMREVGSSRDVRARPARVLTRRRVRRRPYRLVAVIIRSGARGWPRRRWRDPRRRGG